MKVEWAPRALHEWENTVRYIYREFGRKAAEEFEQSVAKWEARIAINPELAHQELLFYVEEDIVYISDLWDMRREPSRLSRRLK